jgi:C-terminal processing protease CtpA/Prc
MRILAITLSAALLLSVGLFGSAVQAEALDPSRPLWMRSPAISPDGKTIAFTYRGRIYTVDSAGGDATALTDPQFRSIKAEGAVVDVRFNTGGFLHDQLITFLTSNRHSGMVTRNGVDLGLTPLDRWARPTVLVQNAFSYSDGSIFPSYYKREGLGPIVGDRVPGTGTAVFETPQLEPRLVFAVAQLGFRTKEGQFFENTEIEPDILVPTEPNFIVDGRDPQLEEAVRALLARLDGK